MAPITYASDLPPTTFPRRPSSTTSGNTTDVTILSPVPHSNPPSLLSFGSRSPSSEVPVPVHAQGQPPDTLAGVESDPSLTTPLPASLRTSSAIPPSHLHPPRSPPTPSPSPHNTSSKRPSFGSYSDPAAGGTAEAQEAGGIVAESIYPTRTTTEFERPNYIISQFAKSRGAWRKGRPQQLAAWQKDFKHDWVDMSKPDLQRSLEIGLEWQKKPLKTKGRAERLADIESDRARPRGIYHTDLTRWTCSCPAYLISRFLLCKHLVRKANEQLKLESKTSLKFFKQLRRQHYPPFYHIDGIHPGNPVRPLPIPSSPTSHQEEIIDLRDVNINAIITQQIEESEIELGGLSVEKRCRAGVMAKPQ
ncbi:hypothetical protein M422DRAFT_783012 [Sphaerobolus stellatus SS14]|uniref:SWIM-type domain-containing protein n=1 Tax=Sphaerobolus stellatus (strain SS14) TaxID=990650 RepID=A0A0C9V931_SPHS4|nr:hypothetical protein M422DRAFT_783012 [Sphaerobolus stellatus SS14]